MQRSVEIFSATILLIVGLSHVLQPRAWVEYFTWLRSKGHAGVFVNGAMALAFGAFIAAFHNVWRGLPIVLTLLGWAQVLKGAISFILPSLAMRGLMMVSIERAWHFVVGGVFAIALSAIIWYMALGV